MAAARPLWLRGGIWAFALFGLLAAIALIFLLAMIVVGDFGGNNQPAKVAAGAGESKVTFTVGDPQPLAGTGLIRMTVAASGGQSDAYSSRGRGADNRNILLIDKTSGASRRLLPDNNHHILDSHFLSATTGPGGDEIVRAADLAGSEPEESPIAYYFMEIAPTGGDGESRDVLVGRLADGRQGFIMWGIDGIDTYWMRNPTQLAMMVREHLQLYYRVVDLSSLKLIESRKVAID